MLNASRGARTAGIAAGLVMWMAHAVCAQPLSAQRSAASTQCRRMLAQKASQLSADALRARESCHRRRMLGLLPTATDCNDSTESPASPGMLIARRRLATVASRCATNLTPADENYIPCPAPCQTVAIADFTGVGACLSCLAETAALDAVQTIYATPPAPAGDGETGCQQTIGRSLVEYWMRRFRVQRECQYAEDRSPTGIDCRSGATSSLLVSARDALDAAVAQCSAADLTALHSCANTVSLEQDCVRTTAENGTDSLFAAIFPPMVDAPFSGQPCPAAGEPFVNCWQIGRAHV